MKGLACIVVLAATLLAMVAAYAINPPGAPADHFLSYKTKTTKGTTKFAPLRGVRLADEFEDLNFDVKVVGDALVPIGTNGGAVTDAATHLRGYKIKAVKGSPKHVKRLRTPVINHLGTLLVDTVKPDLLLVPTAADPAISPPPPNPATHNVDHYKCYLVRPSKGADKLPKGLQVTIADPFTHAAKVLTLRALKHLCLPVDKKTEGIKNRLGELACYTVAPAKGQPKHAAQRALQVNNQFGPLALDTVKENELCVPAVAAVPTPTPAPSNGGLPIATITPTPGVTSVQSATPTVVSTAGLPPDPATVAPPPEPGAATNVSDATEFLYTGPNPIQTGVAPGTIQPELATVVRGKVLDGSGAPLSGVAITILDHPEFGQTLSRADGVFDLAVNGGGVLTISYKKASFLPVQRQLNVPWQDYAVAADVVMVQRDTQVTTVDLTAPVPMQPARGSQVSDADGTRRATVLISQGTQAEVVQPGGSTQPASTLSIRFTEYTVGPRGPAAMPAALPATSGYTYAVEISADEAPTKINGKDVLFSQPVFFYVENFLDFPTGTIVPVGFYDGDKAAWIPSSNGHVVEIVGETGGLADLDTDGDGVADDGAGLGITSVERQQLASLYQTGQSLWRVPLSHFSTWDLNLPFGLPSDATSPNVGEPETDESVDQCLEEAPANSVIECQNQILGETVGVVGTPFALDYRSDRVPGRTAAKTLSTQLSGASVPASLKRIELDIQVAGRVFRETFPATANQSTTFTWDGKDAYGRTLQGSQRVTGNIGYVYDGVYTQPGTSGPAFGLSGGTPITASVSRQEVTISQPFARAIGPWDARGQSLGAWTLNVHHAYDPASRVLYLGNGQRQSAISFKGITTVAGTGTAGFSGDGEATQAQLNRPFGLAVRRDGSFYIADSGNRRVRLVAPDGTLTTVAGTGAFGSSGDGGLATEATLTDVRAVALGPDGSLYIADNRSHNIRRVAPDGIITSVAGIAGTFGFSGDGGPATEAELAFPVGLAVGPDGTLYIGESGNHVIRRVAPDGIITTLAGVGTDGFSGDGGPATQAQMEFPTGVALGPDGSLYIVDVSNDRIRRVTPDGIITTVAGTDTPISGDGGPATQAQLSGLFGIAVGPDGSLYITDNGRIRRVAPDQIITTVAGTGTCCFSGDGGPATQAQLSNPLEVALGPDGSLYIADFGGHRIRQVAPPLPGFSGSDIAVASEDGGSIYQFDAAGRHLRTLDSLTAAAIYTFTYDAAGRLDTIRDGDGNETTIQHDADGKPTAIVGPFGQQTTLTVDANGFLASVTNPADETVAMIYTADGLLTAFTDARDQVSSYEYDELGRLIRTDDPAGGSNTLTRTELPNGHELSKTTALGRTSTYRVEGLPTGDQRLTTTASDGTVARIDLKQDGTQIALLPDGTTATTVLGPDPRFGMQAPVVTSAIVELPSGLTFASSQARTVVLSDPDDPLSVSTLTQTSTVNGRTTTRQYDRATNTLTETTPEGRQRIDTLDVLRRVVRSDAAGLAPITYAYDAHGLLTSVVEGIDPTTRTMQVTYDDRGYVERIDQPEGLRTDASRDDAGRVSTIVLPGNRTLAFGYDAGGNVTSITPPGRPLQLFAHDARGRLSGYTAPDAGDGPETTAATYDVDRQITQRELPGGATIDLAYDATTGRLVSQTLARGTITYAFDPTTGHLASITAPEGVVLAYETDGPLASRTEWSGPVPGVVERVHDDDFRTASLAVNGGNEITTSYDGDGLVVGAGGLTIVRDAATGRVFTTALGDVTDARAYDDFDELTDYGAAFDGTSVFDVQLVQDDLGRVVERTETIGGVTATLTYVYDAASRLAEVREGATTIASYAYDTNGNRLSLTTSGGTVNGTYDAQDRLLQYGSTSFAYDAAGQLTSKTVGGQTTTYDYDETGNLLEVSLPSGTVIEYLIDGANRRIGRKVNGTLTEGFLYQDRVRPIAALDGSGNVVSRFVHALPGTAPDFMIKGGATFRIVTDPIGSPRLVVDVATGNVAQRMDYDEFGNVTLDTNPGFQPFGFAGGLYDPTTKLVRFGVRDYDAATGRFTAKDPALVGEESLYAYAANDPVNLVDRLGRTPNPWDDWLKEPPDILRPLGGSDPLEPKETQVFDSPGLQESPAIRKAIKELVGDQRSIALLQKLDALEFAAKRLAPPAKVCIFLATVAGLADRAEAADRNVIDQALVEQSPIEPEVGAEAIRSGAESILGPIKDAIRGAFEDLAQRPL